MTLLNYVLVSIGIKVVAGKTEPNLKYVAYTEPDYITIDGCGDSTEASPKAIEDATSISTIYALHRARKYLDSHHLNIDLVNTSVFRTSGDINGC